MKLPGKIVLTLLLLLLLGIVTLYVLLQTQWGAGWIGRQVSSGSQYQFSTSKIEHDFSSPGHLILSDVLFGVKGAPATLVAKSVDLGLGIGQLTRPLHFASIRLNQGLPNLNQPSATGLTADRLQLSQMTINSASGAWPLQAQGVDGGIIPWAPAKENIFGEQSRFQLSAGSVSLNGVALSNALVQGQVKDGGLVVSNLGADVALGSITGNGQRDKQGHWQVDNLRLNSIRLQSDKNLSDFLRPLQTLPGMEIHRLDMTDARLEGQGWAVTDLDLTLKDITVNAGDWQSEHGSLSMNASNFVNGSLELNDPIANLDFTPQGITLTQFSSRWVNGLVRAQGNWTRANHTLTLDEAVLAGLEYTLPVNWREHWMQDLPEWLESVQIRKLSASRNLIIDVNPEFPFQMTSLDGTGTNLILARQHQWGVWGGTLNLNAAEATFNRNDIRHPSLALTANDQQIAISELSAFSGEGMIEGKADIGQPPQRPLNLTLTGRQVPVNLLSNWGWPALPLSGKGNLQLTLQGNLQADKALKPTVNATLSATSTEKSVTQRMVYGEVTAP